MRDDNSESQLTSTPPEPDNATSEVSASGTRNSDRGHASSGKSHVISFVVIAYLVSWTVWILSSHLTGTISISVGRFWVNIPRKGLADALGSCGPGIAAFAVLSRESGMRGIRELVRGLIPHDAKWIAIVVLAPAILILYSLSVVGFSFHDFLHAPSAEKWLRLFALNLPLAPLWEELGWRGYLLPKLENSMTPLVASLIVGGIWGLWHIPLHPSMNILGSFNGSFFVCFILFVLSLSVLFAWIYNATKGNLAVLVLLHSSLDASIIVFLGQAMAGTGMKPFWAVTAATWFVALVTLLVVGPKLCYKRD